MARGRPSLLANTMAPTPPRLLLVCGVGLLLGWAAPAGAQTTTTGASSPWGAAGPVRRSVPDPCGGGSSTAGLPPGFSETVVGDGWDQPLGAVFDPLGRLIVWEKGGAVWIVADGVKLPAPLVDLSEEVGNWESHGLKGLALDPDFLRNGYLYLLYAVDKHHLLHHGTASYDPLADQYWENTIGRLTRYTVNPGDGFTSVDPASRTILLGATASDGIPICGIHGVGTVAFFHDGTLMVSAGDSSQDGYGTSSCVADGILQPKEEVGSRRSQLLDSYSGKILRLDPASGHGVADNPWFEPSDPGAKRSKVWALGLRNPFRVSVRPEHHEAGPADDGEGPGMLVIGDVGAATWEELNVSHGGENFGWPMWEGVEPNLPILAAPMENLDAPNPLAGSGGCTQTYFHFQDLLVEASLNPLVWPNPCDPTKEIPPSTERFVHTRPALSWKHFTGPAVVPTFDGVGEADSVALGAPGAPVVGQSFHGNCSVAGAWYQGTSFPGTYHGSYFHADYGALWIRNLVFDHGGNLLEVRDFLPTSGSVVALASDPVSGDLVYIDIESPDPVRRVTYSVNNSPPVAIFSATPDHGPEPLVVTLDASESFDPEGQPLTYVWDFGDGSPSIEGRIVTHAFPTADLSGQGTVVSKLDELVPPVPMGLGSQDPNVIRDGVIPPVGSTDPAMQFDTSHVDLASGLPDKGPLDWVGYTFAGAHELRELVFTEGIRWPAQVGGWFVLPDVEVRDAGTGAWTPATNVAFRPNYPLPSDPLLGGLSFQRFHITFDPVQGDGVRLIGQPGGSGQFVSVGELRALATGPPVGAPTNYTVTLRVRDNVGQVACTTLDISTNNTPPAVSITSPIHGTSIDATTPVTLPFTATVSDAEHATWDCSWQLVLVHDNHEHPEPVDPNCLSSGTFVAHGSDPGDVIYWRADHVVTDPLGLTTVASAYLYQAHDCNFNGIDDALDIAAGTSLDVDLDGRPDECQTDCNANGVHDLFDIVIGTSADADGDGKPDECP